LLYIQNFSIFFELFYPKELTEEMGHDMKSRVILFEDLEYLCCDLDAIVKFEVILSNGLHQVQELMIFEKEASSFGIHLDVSQQVVFIRKELLYRADELIEAYIFIHDSLEIATELGLWLVYYGDGLPLLLRLFNTFLIVLLSYLNELMLLDDLF
jgi:hypothetical protein